MILSSFTTAMEALGAPVFVRTSATALSMLAGSVSCASSGAAEKIKRRASLRIVAGILTSVPVAQLECDRRSSGARIERRRSIAIDMHVFEAAAQVIAIVVKPCDCPGGSMLAVRVVRSPRIGPSREAFDSRRESARRALMRQQQIGGIEIHLEASARKSNRCRS